MGLRLRKDGQLEGYAALERGVAATPNTKPVSVMEKVAVLVAHNHGYRVPVETSGA